MIIRKEYFYFILYMSMLLFCLFKPPFSYTSENAVLAIITGGALFFLYLWEVKRFTYYLIVMLFITYFLFQFFLYSISASFTMLSSSLGVLFLSNLLKMHRVKTVTFNKNVIFYTTIISVLLSCLFIYESHVGRYSTFNGDPNYTALVISVPLLLALNVATTRFKKISCYILLFLTAFFTSSRTLVIGLIIFLFMFNRVGKKGNFALFLFVFLFSIFSQYMVAYVLKDFMQHFDLGQSYRLFNFDDDSNRIRIVSYISAVDMIYKNFSYFIFNGARYYSDWNQYAENIPHNWFVQSVFGYGLLMTLGFCLLYIIGAYKLNRVEPIFLPYISYIVFFGGILSVYPFQIPLCLIIIFFVLNINGATGDEK